MTNSFLVLLLDFFVCLPCVVTSVNILKGRAVLH